MNNVIEEAARHQHGVLRGGVALANLLTPIPLQWGSHIRLEPDTGTGAACSHILAHEQAVRPGSPASHTHLGHQEAGS